MSPLWTAAALMAATGGRMGREFNAGSVWIDTRGMAPGGLFVALRGQTDGHAHARAALAAGAAGVLLDHVPEGVDPAGPTLLVADTGNALTALGAAGRARFAGPVVAVTGSVGKTTTKDMLRLALSAALPGAAPAHAAEASHNNHWGVPLTLARLPVTAAACVVEIGMNHAGEIAPLSRLAAPDVVAITQLGASHIGQLGSLEAIADEKASIAAGLRAGGVAVLPGDTPLLDRLRAGIAAGSRKPTVVTVGTTAGCDVRLLELDADAQGSVVAASLMGSPIRMRLNVPGRHMALNALTTLACVQACGGEVHAAAEALAGFQAGAGRGLRRHVALRDGSLLLLDESYNASAASIRAALDVLAGQPARRRVVVLGDIRELGAHAQAEHAGLAAPVLAVADMLFTCGPEMRHLHAAMQPSALCCVHAPDAATLATLVAEAVRPGDTVLVKGSNGSRMRLVIQALDALATADAA